jgi:hypothetical protein
MAPAAKASQPGYTSAAIYVAETTWQDVRAHVLPLKVSASSLVAALLEEYMANPDAHADVVARAREITIGRRRRAE